MDDKLNKLKSEHGINVTELYIESKKVNGHYKITLFINAEKDKPGKTHISFDLKLGNSFVFKNLMPIEAGRKQYTSIMPEDINESPVEIVFYRSMPGKGPNQLDSVIVEKKEKIKTDNNNRYQTEKELLKSQFHSKKYQKLDNKETMLENNQQKISRQSINLEKKIRSLELRIKQLEGIISELKKTDHKIEGLNIRITKEIENFVEKIESRFQSKIEAMQKEIIVEVVRSKIENYRKIMRLILESLNLPNLDMEHKLKVQNMLNALTDEVISILVKTGLKIDNVNSYPFMVERIYPIKEKIQQIQKKLGNPEELIEKEYKVLKNITKMYYEKYNKGEDLSLFKNKFIIEIEQTINDVEKKITEEIKVYQKVCFRNEEEIYNELEEFISNTVLCFIDSILEEIKEWSITTNGVKNLSENDIDEARRAIMLSLDIRPVQIQAGFTEFDPEQHEKLDEEIRPELPKKTVLEVRLGGYLFGPTGRNIRKAGVVVSF